MPEINDSFNFERDGRRSVRANLVKGSKTEQAHRGACDINKIVSRANRTGLLPQRGTPGFYGDFSNIGTYQDCVQRLKNADDAFMALPAKIRREFKNDPQRLIDFVSDEQNRQKAIELGILPKPEPVKPEPAPEPVEPPVA